MAAWRHYSTWTEKTYESYRSYVARMAPTKRGEKDDCADLSLDLMIDFASSNGLPLNFWDASGTLYASKALCPFDSDKKPRTTETYRITDQFKLIVKKYIQTKSLYLYNTDKNDSAPEPGDLMIRYTTKMTIFGERTDLHHTALVFAAYPAWRPHPKENAEDVPSFPGGKAAMDQTSVNEYFRGTVYTDGSKWDGTTKYRVADGDIHFDYLNSRGDDKRNAELIYFANYDQLSKEGFEFRIYAPAVLWGWDDWDGVGYPPLLDTRKAAATLIR
jgi:hypothetical protein